MEGGPAIAVLEGIKEIIQTLKNGDNPEPKAEITDFL
jgi:hypothetical protein